MAPQPYVTIGVVAPVDCVAQDRHPDGSIIMIPSASQSSIMSSFTFDEFNSFFLEGSPAVGKGSGAHEAPPSYT